MRRFTRNRIVSSLDLVNSIVDMDSFIRARQALYSNHLEITTSNEPTSKIQETTKILPAGEYKVTLSYSWNTDTTTTDFISNLTIDGQSISGIVEGSTHRQEPKDSSATDLEAVAEGLRSPDGSLDSNSIQKHSFTKIYIVNFDEEKTHDVSLTWQSESNGVESSIWDAVIMIEKIDFI